MLSYGWLQEEAIVAGYGWWVKPLENGQTQFLCRIFSWALKAYHPFAAVTPVPLSKDQKALAQYWPAPWCLTFATDLTNFTITLQGNLWVSTTHWTYGKSSMSIKESNTSMLWESDKAANHQGIRRIAAILGTGLPFSIYSNLLSSDMISRTTVHFWSVHVNASCT